ncbi:hypothetical protein [Vibrio sagamiensis]|uniref:Uncharacterized protein n=1 Tax=Vibrio sagamiensis NBRC 104589 TaxID=1219064 RepID=A0A511QIF7_9VIBR|nr:hypothetical protein [Vibrio sagamiensis]GEM77083.1 hypothetical protein VSA01S_31950 [Vibrio sagamiensis NBRC 104589]
MSDTTPNLVTIINDLAEELIVYTTIGNNDVDPNNLKPEDLQQTYTKIGTVKGNASASINIDEALARLVFARSDNQFPVGLWVPNFFAPSGTQSYTVTSESEEASNQAWAFYKMYIAEPYSPIALQFNEVLLNSDNIDTLNTQIDNFFSSTPYKGCSYFAFSIVSHWARNYLYGWSGVYYAYEMPSDELGYVFPSELSATISVSQGIATYTPSDGSAQQTLIYKDGSLSSAGASSSSGILLNGIYRALAWENKPNSFSMCWLGKKNGHSFMAQPYSGPDVPWWVISYDLAYTSYLGVQVYMNVDMAVTILKHIPGGIAALKNQAESLYNSVANRFKSSNESASFEPEGVDDLDPVNVDIDVDVDVDTDIDVVQDTDVDVDVDVDIDVDIVFVDVDVDIDIDIDVVQDVDTDIDVDVDVDIDTDIDVPPGTVDSFINKVGQWVIKEGFPFLAQNLAIMFAFQSASKLLSVWRKASEENLHNQAPQQASATGMLVSYMLNDKNSIETRWQTFADWVQQASPNVSEQQMLIASIMMTSNAVADKALQEWKWPEANEDDLINRMVAAGTGSDQYKAYLTLSEVTYQEKTLPIKVGCGLTVRYLTKISS